MSARQTMLDALAVLLKPLIRILLRHGIAFDDFAKVARRSYVEVAHKEFQPAGRKQTQSHVAVITGVHRHEVKRILQREPAAESYQAAHNRAARVIEGWRTDAEFCGDDGPRQLQLDTSFKSLVSRYSGDITPRPILDELVRVGAVQRQGDKLDLLVEAYVPLASNDDMLQIVGSSVADLIDTLDHNLSAANNHQRVQISVVHDNLPTEVMDTLEVVSRDKSMQFLQDMNRFFATQDRDSNPSLEGSGRHRAGIGLYFFRQDIEDTE